MIIEIVLGVLLVLISLCLIFVVLLQQPKNEGGNISMGIGAMKDMISVPQISELLYKITYFIFALLVVFTFLFTAALASYYGAVDSLDT